MTALWRGLVRVPGDDLNIWADAINRVLQLRKLVSDTMTMRDFFELDIGRVLSFADSANNLSDALTVSLLGLYLEEPADTMSMSDGVSLFRADALQIGDSLKNYLEKLQILFNFFITHADSMNNLSDSAVVNRISHPTKSVADTLNSFADTVSMNLAEVSNCFA